MDPDDPRDENDGEELEAEIMRADHAFGAELRRAAIDEAVAVVDDGDPDTEDELVAEGSVVTDEYTSPEDAAVSVRDEAPGATDHPDPHTDR
jgi:hypothetical protein